MLPEAGGTAPPPTPTPSFQNRKCVPLCVCRGVGPGRKWGFTPWSGAPGRFVHGVWSECLLHRQEVLWSLTYICMYVCMHGSNNPVTALVRFSGTASCIFARYAYMGCVYSRCIHCVCSFVITSCLLWPLRSTVRLIPYFNLRNCENSLRWIFRFWCHCCGSHSQAWM